MLLNFACILGLAVVIGLIVVFSGLIGWIYRLIRPGIPREEKEYEAYCIGLFEVPSPNAAHYDLDVPYSAASYESAMAIATDGIWEAFGANQTPELYEDTIKAYPRLKNIYYDLKFKAQRECNQKHKTAREGAIAYATNPEKYREWVTKYPYAATDFSEFLYKRQILINEEAAKWKPFKDGVIVLLVIISIVLSVTAVWLISKI